MSNVVVGGAEGGTKDLTRVDKRGLEQVSHGRGEGNLGGVGKWWEQEKK